MRSIRNRLTLILMGLFFLLLGAGSLLIYYSTRSALLGEIDARLRVEALSVVKQSKQDKDDEDEIAAREGKTTIVRRELEVAFTDKYMPEFQDSGTEFYQVTARGGKFVFRSRSLHGADLPRQSGTVENPFFWTLKLPNGAKGRAIAMDFIPPTPERSQRWHDPNFMANLVVATSLGEFHKTLAVLRGVLAGVSAIGLLATLVAIPLVLGHGLSPLRQVALHASTLKASNLQTRFRTDGLPSELQPICGQLNALLERLEISFEREKRFSADVAHELRTPIAELRSLSEVCIQWPEKGREEAVFQDSLAIARQMEAIVASLLAISRCEENGQVKDMAPVDICGLLEKCLVPFIGEADAKELRRTVSIPKGSTVEGNVAMLSLVITNLVSNAVAYTPKGGVLEIEFSKENAFGKMTFKNTVDHLKKEDVPFLFKRFWRKDAARSSSHHSGLGLALCQAYADAMNMKIGAEFVSDKELVVSLVMPIPRTNT
jgi:signal transduction histidine kinase